MSNVVNITGASLATESGAVTAANSGLSAVTASSESASGFLYSTVTGVDIPPDLTANGSGNYVIMTADQVNYPYLGTLNISSAAQNGAAFTTGGMLVECWIRCSTLGALASGDHRDDLLIHHVGTSTTARLRLSGLIMRAASDSATDMGSDDGLAFIAQYNVARPTGSTTMGLPRGTANPTTTNFAHPVMRFGEWFKLGIQHVKHATEGRMSVYLNDTLVLEAGNYDAVATDIIASDAASHRIQFPYHANLQWDVAGPIAMYDATGGYPTINPRHDLVPDNSSVTQALFHNDWLDDPGDTPGTFWAYTKPAGSPTIALTEYATGGTRPYTSRAVVTSAANSDAVKIKSRDDIGTLPYRTIDGWATVAFQDILYNSQTAIDIALRNAADDGNLATLGIDVSGNLSVNGTDTLIDLTGAIHYHIALHLNSDGGCRVTVYDLTTDTLTVAFAWSATCTNWTAGALGPIVVDLVYSASASSGKIVQFGTVSICETWEIAGYDSLSEANVNVLTPVMAGPNHLTAAHAAHRAVTQVPGGRFGRHAEWAAIGQGRRALALVAGRSGGKQKDWHDNALPGMKHTRGARLWVLDGGSVNDTGGFATVGDADEAASEAARMNADTESILAQWVGVQGNEAWLNTMSYRTLFTGWGVDWSAFVDARNAGLLNIARKFQTGNRITFSDTSSIDMDTDDNVHPSTQESYDITIAAIGATATPARSTNMSFLSVRSDLAPVVTWRGDDASAGMVASTGGGDSLGILGTGHAYSQTGLVPDLVEISTAVKCGTLATSGFYNGSTTTTNTKASTIRSLEVWFHVDDLLVSPNMYLIGRNSPASPFTGYYAISIEYTSTTAGKIQAYWDDGTNGNKSSITTVDVVSNQTTHHIVCTYVTGAAGITIYVDGEAVAKTDGTTAPSGTALNRMSIGIATSGSRGAALTRLDEVSVYDTTLSAAEALSLYNGFTASTGGFLSARRNLGMGMGMGMG